MSDWRPFVNPIQMGRDSLWLVVPLCIVLAVVYKTIRIRNLRRLPLQILSLWVYILVGLAVLAFAFYLLLEYFA